MDSVPGTVMLNSFDAQIENVQLGKGGGVFVRLIIGETNFNGVELGNLLEFLHEILSSTGLRKTVTTWLESTDIVVRYFRDELADQGRLEFLNGSYKVVETEVHVGDLSLDCEKIEGIIARF